MEYPPDLFRIERSFFLSDKLLSQKHPKEALLYFSGWFHTALRGVLFLELNKMRHSCLHISAFRIDDDTLLRIANTSQIVPLHQEWEETDFNANHACYAPEHLIWLGVKNGHSFSAIYTYLENENYGLEVIAGQFSSIPTDRKTMEVVYKDVVEDSMRYKHKEHSWMIGRVFLDAYLEILAWPNVLTTSFYKEDHERFMHVMERMLHPNPKYRWSVEQALVFWDPTFSTKSLLAEVQEDLDLQEQSEQPVKPEQVETSQQPVQVEQAEQSQPPSESQSHSHTPKTYAPRMHISRDHTSRAKTRRAAKH
jgi:hypothetical protein